MAIERLHWPSENNTRAGHRLGNDFTDEGSSIHLPNRYLLNHHCVPGIGEEVTNMTGTPELGKSIIFKMPWIGPGKLDMLSYP